MFCSRLILSQNHGRKKLCKNHNTLQGYIIKKGQSIYVRIHMKRLNNYFKNNKTLFWQNLTNSTYNILRVHKLVYNFSQCVLWELSFRPSQWLVFLNIKIYSRGVQSETNQHAMGPTINWDLLKMLLIALEINTVSTTTKKLISFSFFFVEKEIIIAPTDYVVR